MHTKLTPLSASILLAAAVAPGAVLACGTDAYLGQVCVIANSFCPDGTVEAAGQTMSVNENQALFSLLGNTFGGTYPNTFALPDLRGRAPVGYGQGLGLAYHPFGDKFGSEYTTLSQTQLPMHTHTATFTPSGGGSGGTASGTVNIPVSGNVAGISVSSTPNLTASTSGTVKLANTTGGGSQTPTVGGVLTTTGSTGVKPYGTAGNSDFALGGTQTFSGPVTGTINNTVTGGTVSGTASGTVSLPVTGGSSGGGTVTLATAGSSQPVAIVPPELALRYCIVTNGYYPPRP